MQGYGAEYLGFPSCRTPATQTHDQAKGPCVYKIHTLLVTSIALQAEHLNLLQELISLHHKLVLVFQMARLAPHRAIVDLLLATALRRCRTRDIGAPSCWTES
jgi:hypothetical protein